MNEGNTKIKVLIIDNNSNDVSLISEYLKNDCMYEVDIANRLYSGIVLALEKTVDIVLLDLMLPDSIGVETFSEFYSHYPNRPVIICTSISDKDTVLKAVQSGAEEYFVKGEVGIKQIARSLQYTYEKFKTKGKINQTSEWVWEKFSKSGITNREKEVLSLLARGKTNEEISSALYLTVSTIRNHISNIFKKLRISNRSQATSVAIRAGLVKEENEDISFSRIKSKRHNSNWSKVSM